MSGSAALILEEHPNWTPNQVKGALMSTLVNVPGAGGEVNVHARDEAPRNLTSNAGLTPEHPDRLGHRPDRLDPGELPPGELPQRSDSERSRPAGAGRASGAIARSMDGQRSETDPTRASFRRASLREATFRKTADFDK